MPIFRRNARGRMGPSRTSRGLKGEGEEKYGFQGEFLREGEAKAKWLARSRNKLLRKTVGEGGRRRRQKPAKCEKLEEFRP